MAEEEVGERALLLKVEKLLVLMLLELLLLWLMVLQIPGCFQRALVGGEQRGTTS